MIGSALCRVAGRAVPIFPGAETPLLVSQRQARAPQAAALSGWDYETSFPRGQAVEFMRQTIRTHPGEVILLAIGPLTNVALLFAVDPEIPSLLKGLVLMCGLFTGPTAGFGPLEWNAMLDPHATAVVYRATVATHRSIGLDVTTQVTMSARQVRERFQSDLLQPVLDFAEVWFQERDTITFHDPLAAATIFDDEICRFEEGVVEVELTNDELRGFTSWQPDGPDARHEVALQVDSARFFARFFPSLQ
jgi:inosine-uridine nucleoside N-ribohydrolase